MPGKYVESRSDESDVLCVRCQASSATIVVRTEHLCKDCFAHYVGSKVAKRMDGFKVRGASKDKKRRLLLPLSLGVSSITLLHVLDHQLSIQQERTSRTGYELHVLYVQDVVNTKESNASEVFLRIKGRYPLHTYETVSLDDYRHVTEDQEQLRTSIEQSSALPTSPHESTQHSSTLQEYLKSLPSATSRADMLGIIRTRVITDYAKKIGCGSILWGDSTTRLAERTLAETAKGRGFSIPWHTSDGPSPYGIDYVFPMRDLLRKELFTYSSVTDPPLSNLILDHQDIGSTSVSSKDITVDDLMTQYFETVEQNYPSIVSNVVRTSGRLQPTSFVTENSTLCNICHLPVAHGEEGLYGWDGDQKVTIDGSQSGGLVNGSRSLLCYGCSRTILG